MSGVFGFVNRNWVLVAGPTPVPKNDNALKFGILGAAKIA